MVNEAKIIGFLQNVSLFQALNQKQLAMLAKRFVERHYAAGTEIVTQGQGGEGFFIIEEGGADVLRLRADGSKAKVNQFGPSDFFGEMALLDEEGLRTASVIATAETRCLVLTRWDFMAALQEDADMAVSVLKELARRFRMALDSIQ